MEGDQLIAQTRHLHLAAAASSSCRNETTDDQMSDPDAGQSPLALSVPASPRSLSVEGGGASTSPTGRVPSTTPRDLDVVVFVDDDDTRTSPAARCDGFIRGHTGDDAPDEDSGDRGRGVRLGRSTAAAAARPSASQHGLARGLVDRDEVDDTSTVRDRGTGAGDATADSPSPSSSVALVSPSSWRRRPAAALDGLPVEVVFHIMSFLDVDDLLSVSRTCHQLRTVSLTPLLHAYRLQRTRLLLPPKLSSPSRPSLADLIARSIFLTQTTVVSRRLARSLVSIRLARRLAARPDPETLAERAVLPKECLPPRPGDYHHHHHHGLRGDGGEAGPGRKTDRTARMKTTKTATVSPALVQQRRRVEKERIKDGLRRWVGAQWLRAVREKGESVRLREERFGVGRVWRLTRFWERVSRGEAMLGQ